MTEQQPKSFWETLPGFVTAVGGLIAAVATLIGAMKSAGWIGNSTESASSATTVASAPLPATSSVASDEAANAGSGRASSEQGASSKSVPPPLEEEKAIPPSIEEEAPSPSAMELGKTTVQRVPVQRYVYVMTHTAPNGKVSTLRTNLVDDGDARHWARELVARDGGTVSVPLQDGTTFTWK